LELRRERLQLGVRLTEHDAGPEPRYDWDTAVLARGAHSIGKPYVDLLRNIYGRRQKQTKSGRQHTGNLRVDVIDTRAFPDYPGVGGKPAAPQLVADQNSESLLLAPVDARIERPSQRGPCAEQRKKIVGDARRRDMLHLALVFEVGLDGIDDRNLLE